MNKVKILVKRETDTNPGHGKKPEDRSIKELLDYGIVNINKHSGPTSHQVSDYVKKILEIDKAGHSGSLDPRVTGVLAIALGKATPIVTMLLKSGKEYVTLMYLHKDVSEEEIRKVCNEFVGKIKQMPPVKSAVKRIEREREVYFLEILEIKGREVLFKVGCQAGTYIRKLVHDIGQKLGIGAHLKQLIRNRVGPFDEKSWYSLQDLKDAYTFWKEDKKEEELRKIILPFEVAVKNIKKIWILDSTVDAIAHGSPLYVAGVSKLEEGIKNNEVVAVLSLKGELVCLGKAEMAGEDILIFNKGVAVKTERVFMQRRVYPKYKKDNS